MWVRVGVWGVLRQYSDGQTGGQECERAAEWAKGRRTGLANGEARVATNESDWTGRTERVHNPATVKPGGKAGILGRGLTASGTAATIRSRDHLFQIFRLSHLESAGWHSYPP